MKILKILGLGLLVVIILAALFMGLRFRSLGQESQAMDPELGVTASGLKGCPPSPNCVSSNADDDYHKIVAIAGDSARLGGLVKQVIGSIEGAEIGQQTPDYAHITITSTAFGFVDDLELFYNGREIEVRSASRVGNSDLGVNRKRVESLRTLTE